MTTALGTGGLRVSNIGFGCMGVTANFGNKLREREAQKIFRALHHWGCRFYDTNGKRNNIFARGLHEGICGQFVNSVDRKSVKVSTKFDVVDYEGKCDAKSVQSAVDASLERMDLTFIDLYYVTNVQTKEQLLEFMASAKAMVQAGKIKHVGLDMTGGESKLSPAWIAEANEIHPIACVQREYSMIIREAERDLFPILARLNIGLVAFSPLARKLFNTTDAKLLARNHRLSTALEEMATSKSVTATQLTLAWVYAQCQKLGVKVVAIPGTSNINHARQNITAINIQLTDQDMEAITLDLDEAVPQEDEEADAGPPPSFTR